MKTKSEKSYAVAVCLSAIFGIIGVQHFYLGRHLLGIMDVSLSMAALYCFLTGNLLYAAVFFLLDFGHSIFVTIQLLTGNFEDGGGNTVCYPDQILNKMK